MRGEGKRYRKSKLRSENKTQNKETEKEKRRSKTIERHKGGKDVNTKNMGRLERKNKEADSSEEK